MAESLRQEILKYKKLSAPKQLDFFEKFYELVSARPIAKHYLLLLIMSTKYDIFVGAGKFNNKDNDDIIALTTTFEEVITILNTVKFDEVENFMEHIGNYERQALNNYIKEAAQTILNYTRRQKIFLGKNEDATKDSVTKCLESLLNDLNLIEGIYLDYNKASHRDTTSAVLEKKKLAFISTFFKYKTERLLFSFLTIVVVLVLLFWGMFLITNPLIFYNNYMAEINYYILASSILGKVIITTTLFFTLIACLRVYYALQHNEVICQHRADVLACYEALYSTEEEKKFVLAKVTDAVFTQLPTGFSKLQSDEGKSGISLESILSLITRRGSSSG